MDIKKRLETEQHRKLKELQEKLDDVLNYEPADSGDENEDEIWRQANSLKDTLDAFFTCKCDSLC